MFKDAETLACGDHRQLLTTVKRKFACFLCSLIVLLPHREGHLSKLCWWFPEIRLDSYPKIDNNKKATKK